MRSPSLDDKTAQIRIAYVTTYDVSNLNAWSGLGFHIFKALRQSGFQIEAIGGLKNYRWAMSAVKRLYYGRVMSKIYREDRDPEVLKCYSNQVKDVLQCLDYDIVFSPGTIPIAYLEIDKPIVFWSDATFAGMVDFYPNFTNLCAETIRAGNEMEQAALTRCRLAIYSSEWAANSAIKNYDVDPEKVKVVPFGANIDCRRRPKDIVYATAHKTSNVCKLLFVGSDWFRKGGDLVVSIASMLNQQGIETELHVVGCEPPHDVPDFVTVHGFVSRTTEEGRKIFNELYTESHFLIMPSKAECFGVVLAEASSFGLPCLVTDVGGVSTAVRDGLNGKLFSTQDGPDAYCEYIQNLLSSKTEYEKLALSSFQEYSERLNWSSTGRRVYDLICECCSRPAPASCCDD